MTTDAAMLALLRPTQRESKIENADYAAMMLRMIRAWEARVIDDPAGTLAYAVALADRMAEVPNVGIHVSGQRYARDPHASPSISECARTLGINQSNASRRAAIGARIVAARLAAAEVIQLAARRAGRDATKVRPELDRERAMMADAATATVTGMAAYRARHRAA